MATTGVSANRVEMVQQARAVAEELGIDRDIVFRAIEMAYERAGRQQFGSELNVRATIDRASGQVSMLRITTVVEEVENSTSELTLEQARKNDAEAEIGTTYEDPLPVTDFSRVGAMAGKQIIMQNIREAQRERQYEEYKDRVGEVVNGIVKRVEYGHTIVDLGRAEAIIRRNESIPREKFGNGDRVRAYIYEVRRETRGPQIFLSRAHPDLMRELFRQEVPEVYDGIIEIPYIARDPGSRAKIAVTTKDSSIDPVGTCIGMRGSRVQAVVGELAGEKIDIIPFVDDAATFVVNSLKPAEVTKVLLDEEEGRIEVVVPDEMLSLAIGRRGQNVRLASQLTGWSIDIITETDESERRQREFAERTALFMEHLNVDEVVAQLLVTEGFEDIEEVAYVELDELAMIEGFDDDTAQELQARAREHLDKVAAELDAKRRELGVADELLELDGVTLERAVKLGSNDIRTLDDFAGLVPDDLRGWFETRNGERVREEGIFEGENLSEEDVQIMILNARLAAGWISQEDYDAAFAADEDDEDGTDAGDLDDEASSEEEELLAQLAALGGTDAVDTEDNLEEGDDTDGDEDDTQ